VVRQESLCEEFSTPEQLYIAVVVPKLLETVGAIHELPLPLRNVSVVRCDGFKLRLERNGNVSGKHPIAVVLALAKEHTTAFHRS